MRRTSDEVRIDLPLIIPLFNSEEKIDEVNRLLEILAKRKKYSIVVAMLLVFQKYNYQKLFKDCLFDGVKDIIQNNPLRVVSYHGIPFTTTNFFRGMRVEYGKHKLFQKELIEGNEYFYVNLVYTCIYLSDEIAKICKGSKNIKTIHSSLIDEVEFDNKGLKMNFDSSNKGSLLNEKRSRSFYSNERDSCSAIEEKKKQEIEDNKVSEMGIGEAVSQRRKKYGEYPQGHEGVINLHDSDESEEEKKVNSIKNMEENQNNNIIKGENIENTNKEQKNNVSVSKQKNGNNYKEEKKDLKATLEDNLKLFDYSIGSNLYSFLIENTDVIFKIKEIFIAMKEIGKNGQIYVESISKLIPDISEEQIKEGLIKDNQMQEKIQIIDNMFKNYEDKKRTLLYLYQVIQSSVKNLRHLGKTPDKTILKNDIDYINILEKKFEKNTYEIFPLLYEIYQYFIKEFCIQNLIGNLQNVSSGLNKNEITFKTYMNFTQGLSSLFPSVSFNGNNIFNLVLKDNIPFQEREQLLEKTLLGEKDLLLKYIEPLRKFYEEKSKENKEEEKNNKNEENVNN